METRAGGQSPGPGLTSFIAAHGIRSPSGVLLWHYACHEPAPVVTVKVAEACAGAPIGKTASTGYVPGGSEGTTRVVEKVPLDNVVTF